MTEDFEPKMLQCVECGQEFEFTVGEQEFYAEKGFTNLPKRCPACRKARKPAGRGERQFYDTVCRECGGPARIPFPPREGQTYLCSDCFAKAKEEM